MMNLNASFLLCCFIVFSVFSCTLSAIDSFSTSDSPWPHTPHPFQPSALWSSAIKKPYPTNTWWIDLALKGGGAVFPQPYSVQLFKEGAVIGMARKQATIVYVATWFTTGIRIGAQGAHTSSWQVTSFDSMGVNIEYLAGETSPKPAGFSLPLMLGAPYITSVFDGTSPSLTFVDCHLSAINGQQVSDPSASTNLKGSAFTLLLNTSQEWKVYYSKSVEISFDTKGTFFNVNGAQHGLIMRLAALPWEGSAQSAARTVLDRNAACVPIGGDVDVSVSDTKGLVSLKWKLLTEKKCTPLILALPHMQELLKKNSFTSLRYNALMGRMVGIEANTWEWERPLHDISWFGLHPIDSTKRQIIIDQMDRDLKFVGYAPEPYSFGKQICRFARLALIADELNKSDLAKRALDLIEDAFKPWLEGNAGNRLLYDTTWGGTVSEKGIHQQDDDFGGGYYNDHHFHYGYWLYGAAVLARGRPEWGQKWQHHFLSLARDIANPSPSDSSFPVFRHFDWYFGHSWASGLMPFTDGRNQESISEAINAWYALSLFGKAINNAAVERTGRILLAEEMGNGLIYWHSTSRNSVYPAVFAARKGIGMVWGDKVECNTWFGGGPVYSLAINMMPYTPVSELYLTPDWVAEAFPVVLAALKDGDYVDDWQGLFHMAHAVIAPTEAWTALQSLNMRGDEGNTRANTMWWIASRPKPTFSKSGPSMLYSDDEAEGTQIGAGQSTQIGEPSTIQSIIGLGVPDILESRLKMAYVIVGVPAAAIVLVVVAMMIRRKFKFWTAEEELHLVDDEERVASRGATYGGN